MRHTFLVVTVKKWLKSVYIMEVIAKLKQGYHFLDHPVQDDPDNQWNGTHCFA